MSGRSTAVVVCALVFLSGCGAVAGPGGGGATAGGETTAAGGTTAGTVTTPFETSSLVPGDGTGRQATVVDVVDGDTLEVRYGNGTTDTVRLLGIDTPEVHAENDPAEFEGVPDSAAGRNCLRAAGGDASDALRARLAGARVRLVTDPASDRRDRYDRLLAYVVHDGRNVNYWLVASGRARVYDSAFRYDEQFYAAERAARERGVRVWACADSTDTASAGEYVATRNAGKDGWT